ncbi:MAG: hypothetical protein CR974_02605 [Gammaproteobacteria bacterium]|nr:MAG: hypothetical protein CR974_02605 [Gammaproteobacteria bacterium]
MKYLFTLSLLYVPVGFALQCPVDNLAKYTWNDAIVGEQVVVEADNAEASHDVVKLAGNVIAKRGQEVFFGDKVDYDRNSLDLHSPKQLTYGTPDFAIHAEKGDYSFAKQSGEFEQLDYYFNRGAVNGEAEKITIDRKTQIEHLTKATYSSCPRLSRAWAIHADKVILNHDTGMAQAWHSTFRLGSVPVLYLPYFSFPLDDRRKTGFLMPRANLSKTRGLDLTTPFYVNIAPNQDATLYPRLLQRRGFMLGAQYRYLLPDWEGKVSGTYLSHDRKYDDHRWSFSTQHTYQPNEQFKLTGRYQRVSDRDYLSDFEDTLDLSDDKYLESNVLATYSYSPNMRFTAEVKHHQVADAQYSKKSRPYTILPRLTATGNWVLDNGIELASDTEVTNFDHDNKQSGLRLNQTFSAGYRFEKTYGYIEPEARFHLTHYRLRDTPADKEDTFTRAIPSFSVDSRVFFDRQMTWFGSRATQTLEPRLYYLYTPYKDQSDFPRFDSSQTSISSFSSMFLDNRFTGKDRIGDTNQLTTALTSTITDNDSGKSLAKLSVGQVQYFDDRQVSLRRAIATDTRSNVIAEGDVNIYDDINIRGFVHYDTDISRTEKSMLGFSYAPARDKALNLSHLYSRDSYEQVDFSGVWRLNDNWRTFWRWHYSLEYEKTIDALAGVEYADCCWGVRLLARQQREQFKDNSVEPETTYFVEFALKGLGNVGSDTSSALRDVIPKYQPIDYERAR